MKGELLAQRTILENFEVREMVNELRDESCCLRSINNNVNINICARASNNENNGTNCRNMNNNDKLNVLQQNTMWTSKCAQSWEHAHQQQQQLQCKSNGTTCTLPPAVPQALPQVHQRVQLQQLQIQYGVQQRQGQRQLPLRSK